ncbi:hypothetical protein EK904_008112 [Melospiza melodia maxima]|nr:hypothetical protein EK904_008112 [Melospiza melodia maxima]
MCEYHLLLFLENIVSPSSAAEGQHSPTLKPLESQLKDKKKPARGLQPVVLLWKGAVAGCCGESHCVHSPAGIEVSADKVSLLDQVVDEEKLLNNILQSASFPLRLQFLPSMMLAANS